MAGVAPNVTLVNLRAGQDSGYFFLQPTVDALTYAGDNGIDVVNMSYYVDPWLYNCAANPADSPEEQAEQRTIIEATQRALDYARDHGVTLVARARQRATDLAQPDVRRHEPGLPAGHRARPRTVDNSCLNLPTEARRRHRRRRDRPERAQGVLLELRHRADRRVGARAATADYPERRRRLEAGEDDPRAVPGGDVARGRVTSNPDGNPTNAVRREGLPGGVCAYYQYLQGTSMASPHVTGVAALVVSPASATGGRGGLALDAAGDGGDPPGDGDRHAVPRAAHVRVSAPRPAVHRDVRGHRGQQRVLRRRHRERRPRRRRTLI